MKRNAILVLLVMFLACATKIYADEASRAADLKQRLAECQTKVAELRSRRDQLDEELKPENIERSLAGIGSTKPEELREHRRRQLTIERDGLSNQIKLLEDNCERLQTAITTAEGRAYLESAQPAPTPATDMLIAQQITSGNGRWILLGGGALAVVLVVGGIVVFVRKR